MFKRSLIAPLALFLATQSYGAMSITVNTEDGATLSGTHQFVARVQSDHLVTSVEFYVGDDLHDTDQSTPYEFTLDTLEEGDKKIQVTLAAFNSEGESVRKVLNLTLYNGLDKGVDHHVEVSTDHLRDSKFKEAIEAARVALKIEPTNNKARMAMARANFASGVFDIAQKFAEDVVASEPSNADGRALLAAISLRRAFTASGDDSITVIRGSLQSAATNQFEILNQAADAAGEPTGDNLLPYVDAQIRAHQYNRASQALRPVFERDQTDNEIANRLVYSLIRSARFSEAETVIRRHKQFGSPDGYGYTLEAVLLQIRGDVAKSEEAEKEAILEDPTSLALKYAQAYLGIARNRLNVLGTAATDLAQEAPTSSLTNYYLSIRAYATRNTDEARRYYQQAVLADPANYDMFIERANQSLDAVIALSLSGDQAKNQREIARAYLEAALAARPSSFEALTGLAIVNIQLGNSTEAVSYARGATSAGPEYGPAFYALAAANRVAGNMDAARAAMADGAKVDSRLVGLATPRVEEAWAFFIRSGRIPAIPAP